jgi:hypothetical protein
MVKKDEEGTGSKPCSQDSTDQPPPSPTATAAIIGEEAKEQMTAVILTSFGGLKNVKVGKRAVPNATPPERTVNVKVIMRSVESFNTYVSSASLQSLCIYCALENALVSNR